MKSLPIMASVLFMVTACGGGGGDAPVAPAAPTITGVSVSAPNNGQVTLTASATAGVNAFCIKATDTLPLADDNCFSASSNLAINTPATPTRYFVWGKNSANTVTTVFERVVGNCSVAGVTASQASSLPTVCVSTSLGEMVIALESTKAPITTTNFLRYVNDGFYSQTVFHRVISNFMIQGGGYTPTGAYKTTGLKAPIVLEPTTVTGLSNTRGTIAMARTSDFDSATSQFYINVVDNVANTNNNLDGSSGYAVFGQVISGMATVDAIRYTPVTGSVPNVLPIINWSYQLK
ncbi:peptidylprolyl isomerase [Limnohabitans sp. DCL3]|uniref:peptidylprolyl isomerase n=1 Tax=Limnohabitans sp. DCL3 TaxID=3374103 RepID=UPI003A867D82